MLFSNVLIANEIYNKFISSLSKEEQIELEIYFKELITQSEFSYTLFGEKPISIYGYFVRPTAEHLTLGKLEELKVEHNWKIFNQYKKNFLFKNYILLDQPFITPNFPTTGCVRDVILINKKAFIKEIESNIEIFKKYLGNDVEPEKLLKRAEEGEALLAGILQNNELLWGILLGYGVHNAEMYNRLEELTKKIPLLINKEFTSFQEELNSLYARAGSFTSYNPFYLIPLPGFICEENHPQTTELKNTYFHYHNMISKIYSDGNFLDQTLFQLMSE